ncbi:hypothetical protein AWC38_SpisGene9058 [Stylophora pistillata]|uniref:DUF5641 domain-containing protein n=1 Tax=Stylophora pistillata TaxID=50429 RepID=A0A2B4S6F1_STYPI|nr:hypothetical protein AWC38_SpisGene9058 [Stylophora pistillata]
MSTILTVKDQKFTQRLHNIRNASGRFRKVEAIETRKETKIKRLHGGFKTWNAKRKLQYDNISKENEPPAKRMTRAREVSTYKKDPSHYCHRDLPYGKDLQGDSLQSALKSLFDEYSTDIVINKLAPAANSQRNESLNSVVGSKNPKIRFYGGSESNDYRVSCSVSQVNLGYRLAPLKAVSISRLELLGALIGTRPTMQICSALKISTDEVTYWMDSMNVGCWLRGQSRECKPFIAHRVGEIHECSAPSQWRYVPTNANPADYGTRGLTVEDLASTVRVRACVHRFNVNCRRPADQRLKGEVTPLEISDAEEATVREVQAKTYAAEMETLRKNKQIPRQSTLAPLNPMLVNGILRSKTRLQNSDDLPHTHCCHLELASSLDTDALLNAFVRMAGRKGWPQQMLSDNGRNFVGASNELKDLVTAIDQDKVQRMTSNKGVTWKWNPPDGPHFGGVFESMITSAKRTVAAILSDAEMGGDFVPESVYSTPFSLRKRRRRVQEPTRHVWQRWMRENLPHIGSRPKWFFPVENIQVGDVVVVIDPNAIRRDWKVGRIERTYPGPDGLVRVVDVRVKDKVLKRPITRISPLEIQ